MPRLTHLRGLVAALAFLFLASTAAASDLSGTWAGSIQAGATELRLELHVELQEDGSLKATLDSLDQNARGIPVSEISTNEGAVTVEIAAIAAQYQGTLDESGDAIEGNWSQGGHQLPLKLVRLGDEQDSVE